MENWEALISADLAHHQVIDARTLSDIHSRHLPGAPLHGRQVSTVAERFGFDRWPNPHARNGQWSLGDRQAFLYVRRTVTDTHQAIFLCRAFSDKARQSVKDSTGATAARPAKVSTLRPPMGFCMAPGLPEYADYRAAGWTDAQLFDAGHLVRVIVPPVPGTDIAT